MIVPHKNTTLLTSSCWEVFSLQPILCTFCTRSYYYTCAVQSVSFCIGCQLDWLSTCTSSSRNEFRSTHGCTCMVLVHVRYKVSNAMMNNMRTEIISTDTAYNILKFVTDNFFEAKHKRTKTSFKFLFAPT